MSGNQEVHRTDQPALLLQRRAQPAVFRCRLTLERGDLEWGDEGLGPLLFFASTRPGGPGQNDIYVAELLPDGYFTEASLVAELSSTSNDYRPSVRFDGLELFFFSDRPGSVGFDLWVAVRDAVTEPWREPENLGPVVNSEANDQNPHIAADRRSLYFASNRPGAARMDLYVSTRTRTGSK